jgi:outer membrane protein assembly factor BamB
VDNLVFGGVGHKMNEKTQYNVNASRAIFRLGRPYSSIIFCCFFVASAFQISSEAQIRAEDDSDKKVSVGWPVFRGNAQSSGVATTTLPAELDIVWEFKVPQGGFEGTPLIVQLPNGKKTVYIADMDGMLFSIDFQTGEKNWEIKLGIGIAASPAYQDEKIFVGDIDGFFHCVDTSGKLVWKIETGGEINASANFFKGHVLFGSQDGKLYLLNVLDGAAIWELETPDQIQCSTTVAQNRAFVAGCDGFLRVIDLDKGKEVGKADIFSPTQSTPAAFGNQVFFGTEQAEFVAVNWEKPNIDWSFVSEQGQASVRGSAAVNSKHVVFGARNRQVYSLDRKTGKRNWSVTLKAKVESSPVIVGSRVFVGSTDGRFYEIGLEKGKVAWEKQFNGGFLSSPAAAFGKLVIATDRGVVYCLGSE